MSADPLTAYNATMALTKLWRQGDSDRVLKALAASASPVQKQIILKYLIRRRGLACDAPTLLACVQGVIESSDNINLRYLSYCLLEYAPSVATVHYLVRAYRASDDWYLREAVVTTLKALARHHARDFLALIDVCDQAAYADIVHVLPMDIDPSFFGSLAVTLCQKFHDAGFEEHPQELCTSILAILAKNADALKAFVGSIPDTAMKKVLLDTLAVEGTPEAIAAIADVLADMLHDQAPGIRARALALLGTLHEPSLVPRLIVAAESSPDIAWRDEIRGVARMLIEGSAL